MLNTHNVTVYVVNTSSQVKFEGSNHLKVESLGWRLKLQSIFALLSHEPTLLFEKGQNNEKK